MAHTTREDLLEKLRLAGEQTDGELAIQESTEEIMVIQRKAINLFVPDGEPTDYSPLITPEMASQMEVIGREIVTGDRYKHTKSGGEYEIVGVGLNVVSGEPTVAYRELSHTPAITWLRTHSGEDGWIVPTEVSGLPAPRFTKV
ncbi:MAG: hypothetical protein WCV88_06315 [Patescibacteria group bacterium]|jgi:hypothetical protein